MQKIKELQNRLQQQNFSDKFPEIKLEIQEVEGKQVLVPVNDGKIHILYLCPFFNGTGLYRTILPYLHLNETDTHSAVISNILPFSAATNYAEIEILMFDEFIWWAHYIVFPHMFSAELPNFAKKIKEINPNIQIVMDIDDLHIQLPVTHPEYYRQTKTYTNIEIKNIIHFDLITGTNKNLLLEYKQFAKTRYPKNKIDYCELPNLISQYTLPTTTPQQHNNIRILLTVAPAYFTNLYLFRPILKYINKHYPEAEIVIFGWDGILRQHKRPGFIPSKGALEGIKHTYIPPVDLSEYFNKIQEINPDFALMPMLATSIRDETYNLCKSSHKFLQYAQLGIPAIVSNIETYTGIPPSNGPAIHNVTALVAATTTEWKMHIDELMNDAVKRKEIAQKAKEIAEKHFSFNKETIQIFTKCFN